MIGLLVGAAAVSARPQATGTPTSQLTWDQSATTLSEANGYTYRTYSDGSATGVVLTSVICTGVASPFVCTAKLPTYMTGNHRIAATAENGSSESLLSVPLPFLYVTVPPTRLTNLRNQP